MSTPLAFVLCCPFRKKIWLREFASSGVLPPDIISEDGKGAGSGAGSDHSSNANSDGVAGSASPRLLAHRNELRASKWPCSLEGRVDLSMGNFGSSASGVTSRRVSRVSDETWKPPTGERMGACTSAPYHAEGLGKPGRVGSASGARAGAARSSDLGLRCVAMFWRTEDNLQVQVATDRA